MVRSQDGPKARRREQHTQLRVPGPGKGCYGSTNEPPVEVDAGTRSPVVDREIGRAREPYFTQPQDSSCAVALM